MAPKSPVSRRNRKSSPSRADGSDILKKAAKAAAASIAKQWRSEDGFWTEEHFPMLADSMPILVWITDIEKRRHWFNKRWFEYTGRTLEQETGDGWMENVHPDDLQRLLTMFSAAFDRREVFRMEYRLRHHTGQYRWILVDGKPLTQNGVFLGYIGGCIDIDDRKNAEQDLKALQKELASQVEDLRYLQAMSERISNGLELQPILEEALRTAVKLQGTDLGLLSLCDNNESYLSTRASIGFDDVFLEQVKHVPPGGGAYGTCFQLRRRVIVQDTDTDPIFIPYRSAARLAGFRAVHSVPLITSSGRIIGVLSTHFRSPHSPSEREMHLVDLCARQAADCIENARLFEHAQAEIKHRKRMEKAQSEFVSLASHQLRTPLTAIRWIIGTLKSGKTGPLNAVQSEMIDDSDQCAMHMTETIRTMLTISKLEADKPQLETTDVAIAELFHEILAEHKPLYHKKNQTVTIECPVKLNASTDRKILKEALSNLVSNAVKYTPEKGRIAVSAKKKGEDIVITVADNGYGIPKKEQDRIFTKFFRAENVTKTHNEGTGLGLYLVHSLIKILGGRITFTSEENKGTTFIVSLPR